MLIIGPAGILVDQPLLDRFRPLQHVEALFRRLKSVPEIHNLVVTVSEAGLIGCDVGMAGHEPLKELSGAVERGERRLEFLGAGLELAYRQVAIGQVPLEGGVLE